MPSPAKPEPGRLRPAAVDPINAGSPESAPAVRPLAGRGRLAPVLRLVLVGTLVTALLGPVQLEEWAEARPLLAQSSFVQTVVEGLDQALGAVGFSGAYRWLRGQTRALQALRFNAGQDNQQ